MMHHHNHQLQSLVSNVQAGDTDSFAVLYDLLGDRFFRYAMARLGDREMALDAVQDIMVALWESLPKMEYRSEAETYGFFFTIARRRVLALVDTKKRRGRHEVSQEQAAGVEHESNHPDPVLVHKLEKALSSLGGNAEEIMRLRYWAGLSFAEIGRVVKMNETAVRVVHHRICAKLQVSITQS